MYCYRNVTEDLIWVGANDRRLSMFEGVYSVPDGVSYNSYLLMDEKTVLFDTVDKAVSGVFFENLEELLKNRELDYVVVHHMEPDHSATLQELVLRYPQIKIICNAKSAAMMKQFFSFDVDSRAVIVKEGEDLTFGRHVLTFVMAPMVHWPEVMVSYDKTDKILFAADAFGCFGALNGAIFADEVDFERDYLDEARRYYTNIVGKYGPQVQALLKKASGLAIQMICPLHGFVWRENIGFYLDKYDKWSRYEPEEQGVVIAYATIYGNTGNAAEVLACKLREQGVKTVMFDVSVTAASEVIAEVFKMSHLVLASPTYNAGIFVTMEAFLHDLAAHNIQNRTVAVIENGSWAPVSAKLMKEVLKDCKNITYIEPVCSISSSVKEAQYQQICAISDEIAGSIRVQDHTTTVSDPMLKLPYGLYVLTAKDGGKDNGCIINTAVQVTASPNQIAVIVNKMNYTREMICNTGEFNLSILSEEAPLEVFKTFGFQSGRDVDKLAGFDKIAHAENGICYLTAYANAVISAELVDSKDYDTHTLFVAKVKETKVLSEMPSMTYQYYFENVKPKPAAASQEQPKKGFVCEICGYVYEGDTLPEDYVCPICKHGASDFKPLA